MSTHHPRDQVHLLCQFSPQTETVNPTMAQQVRPEHSSGLTNFLHSPPPHPLCSSTRTPPFIQFTGHPSSALRYPAWNSLPKMLPEDSYTSFNAHFKTFQSPAGPLSPLLDSVGSPALRVSSARSTLSGTPSDLIPSMLGVGGVLLGSRGRDSLTWRRWPFSEPSTHLSHIAHLCAQ